MCGLHDGKPARSETPSTCAQKGTHTPLSGDDCQEAFDFIVVSWGLIFAPNSTGSPLRPSTFAIIPRLRPSGHWAIRPIWSESCKADQQDATIRIGFIGQPCRSWTRHIALTQMLRRVVERPHLKPSRVS